MDARPKCIIVSGRPGSGKSTLASELSRRLYLPKVSRDEIKEGYVSTFGVKHDQLPEDTNSKVNEIFFATALGLLRAVYLLFLKPHSNTRCGTWLFLGYRRSHTPLS